MAIRTIVFDFGNVLSYFSHQRGAEQLAAFGPAGLRADDVLSFLNQDDFEPRFETAQITGKEVLASLRSRFGLEGDDERLAFASSDIFTRNHDVCSLVPRLHGRYKLFLLSNTNELHYNVFRPQFDDTLRYFDDVIASHLVRLRKPDPAIYHLVQERAKAEPNECLFIDDLPANIAAARALGWQTIMYGKNVDLVAALARYEVTLNDCGDLTP